jgi:putative transposase
VAGNYPYPELTPNPEPGTAIILRQVKYVNNLVEQEHRGVKRSTRPMLGFKSCATAPSTLSGIERMPLLRKGQSEEGVEQRLTPAQRFSSLAA